MNERIGEIAQANLHAWVEKGQVAYFREPVGKFTHEVTMKQISADEFDVVYVTEEAYSKAEADAITEIEMEEAE